MPERPREHVLRRGWWLELGLGLAVLLAIVLVFRKPPRETPLAGATGAAPAPEERRSLLAEPSSPSGGSRRAEVAPSAVAPGARELPPPGTFCIEVVDEDGRPLAGVPVLLLTFPRDAPNDPYLRRMPDSEPTGAGGRACFELATVARALSGRADLVLQATIGPGLRDAPREEVPADLGEGAVIRLVASRAVADTFEPLRVRVIDAEGAPVGGVRVQWIAWREDRPGARDWIHGGTGETDPESGIAELSLLVHRELRWREQQGGGVHRYRVEALLPLAVRPELDLGTTLPVRELGTLQLPPCGRVDVTVEDGDGSPVSRGEVEISATDLAGPEGRAVTRPVIAGRALFPAVGLGLELVLLARMDDGSRARAELRGPTLAGETVRANLRVGPADRLVSFAAVDERRVPLAETLLEGNIHVTAGGGRAWFPVEVRTDAGGRAEVRIPASHITGATITGARGTDELSELDLRAERSRNEHLFADLTGTLELAGLAEATRELDLGPITFEGPPPSQRELLVSGHVQDELGIPLAGAALTLEPLEDERSWQAHARTGDDGAFELRGPAPEAGLRLTAGADGFLRETREDLTAGAANVVLRLSPAGRFHARVLLDPGIPADLLEASLTDGLNEHSFVLQERANVAGLPPGAYALEIRTVQGRWLVARIGDLPVRGGENPIDPRLDPLDLRGRLGLCRFRCEWAETGPRFPATVLVRVGPWGEGPARTDETGLLVLVIPGGATAIELQPSGFERVRVTPSTEEQAVVFSRRKGE